MTVFEREVTVVGAGPAGAVCASYLAKAGVDVLLLEKDVFPREKPCGDILREGFVYHMEALGAARAVDAMSTCVRNLRLISDAAARRRSRLSVTAFQDTMWTGCWLTRQYRSAQS